MEFNGSKVTFTPTELVAIKENERDLTYPVELGGKVSVLATRQGEKLPPVSKLVYEMPQLEEIGFRGGNFEALFTLGTEIAATSEAAPPVVEELRITHQEGVENE